MAFRELCCVRIGLEWVEDGAEENQLPAGGSQFPEVTSARMANDFRTHEESREPPYNRCKSEGICAKD
jgi:hypothetical protein